MIPDLECTNLINVFKNISREILTNFRQYYLLIEAVESFSELLITAIVDYPPDYSDNSAGAGAVAQENDVGFTIQRMGKL